MPARNPNPILYAPLILYPSESHPFHYYCDESKAESLQKRRSEENKQKEATMKRAYQNRHQLKGRKAEKAQARKQATMAIMTCDNIRRKKKKIFY